MSSAHAPNLCSLSFDMLHRRPDHGGYDCAYAVNVEFRFCQACGRAPSPPFDEAPYPRLDVLERKRGDQLQVRRVADECSGTVWRPRMGKLEEKAKRWHGRNV